MKRAAPYAGRAGAASAAVLVGLLAAGPLAAHDEARFTVRIESVTKGDTLVLPSGAAVPAPIAPGAYAVAAESPLFAIGQPATPELERLAEDGNAEPMVERLAQRSDVGASGLFLPGQPFTVAAKPGDRLSFATMFVQSNDLFYAPAEGVALFDAGGSPRSGIVTAEIVLFDAGTEVNEPPGSGPHQAPRQVAPDSGAAERGTVAPVADGFAYPAPAAVIRLTITAAAAGS